MHLKQKWADATNLNEVEYIKLNKDGLDVIKTIVDKYAKEGYESITSNDMNLFKWAGVYEQKPKNGLFMLRVRITTGIINSEQIKILSSIAKDFGKNIANVTTRGAIQFHYIKVEDLPIIFERLKSVNLCSFEACGDCPRTVVGNALAGIDKDEIIDTSSLAKELNDFFLMNKDFSNLPRKFKISISGSTKNSANAQINDLAYTPAIKIINDKEVVGFNIWVGGGLSTIPKLAKKLDLFVLPKDIVKVASAVCTIFRDYGYREKRNHSRLKFLINDWGVEKFTEKLLTITGPLENSGIDKTTSWNSSYFYGVHEQKQSGKYYIGFNIPLGEITADELEKLAFIAKEYGDNTIRTTLSQNILLSGFTLEKANEITSMDIFKRLSLNPKKTISYTIACTGNEFCNLAIVDTKNIAKSVAQYIDNKNITKVPLRIHFTGCPNSCGQKQIADLSFQGALIKTDSGNFEAFSVWIGGTLDGEGYFADSLNLKVKADNLKYVVENIICFYNENILDNESFHKFYIRNGINVFKDMLSSYNS